MTHPKGIEAQIYGWELVEDADILVICEGELDRLVLMANGIPAITSTHGALTFKKEWVEFISDTTEIYVCFDNDKAGREGTERVCGLLKESGVQKISKITLPLEVGEGGDITDFFVKLRGNLDDLFDKYARPYPEQIDTSIFKPLSAEELIQILGITIKRDEENKLITFLCQLSAHTENAQLNVSFNAPFSTGKSYIPTEIAQLFPEDDVIEVAYCSPTAFSHDVGIYEKDKQGYIVDLSRKILIFLDQPHDQLLQHLRPLLSHDKKETHLKITDKSQRAGMRTKNIFLRGFPSVIFCTAGLRIDEQESTRFLLLSPQINQEKIREAIYEKIRRETDSQSYYRSLEENPDRVLLIKRIRAIKEAHIENIRIGNSYKLEKMFLNPDKKLKPRHQRDVGRVISIIKAFVLLNLWFRDKDETTIVANENDIDEAFRVCNVISESQELNLPPYIHNLYRDVIQAVYQDKNKDLLSDMKLGVTKQDILQNHFEVYSRHLPDWQLRQQIIPTLEISGLITIDSDPNDKRKPIYYPTTPLTKDKANQNYRELDSGVNNDEKGIGQK